MTETRSRPFWLFPAVLACAALIAALSFGIWGLGSEGFLHFTRYTARLAFLIFLIAFSAGALAQLFPSDGTRWLRRNRRYVGLSFALAHFIHLFALTGFFLSIGEAPGMVTIIGGGLAYVFVALMALTSNDWSQRTLGPVLWRRLHLAGSYYIWLIFMRSYLARLASETPPEPKIIFAITAALGFAALGLRIAAWTKKRRKSAPAAA
jgi:DMSO/TMAO reductase YedYZ heme-binding membrane subunit